jgi:HEAT repeat protein
MPNLKVLAPLLLAMPLFASPASDAVDEPAPSVQDLAARAVSGDEPGQYSALQKLGEKGKDAAPAIPSVVAVLSAASSTQSVRMEALVTLGKIGTRECVPALVRALGDRDTHVRVWGARSLGLCAVGTDDAVLALQAASRDPESPVRREAVKALGRVGAPAALTEVTQRAASDPDELVRKSAALAAQQIRQRESERQAAAVKP